MKSLLITGIATGAAAGTACLALALWLPPRPERAATGPGPYAVELEECVDFVDVALGHPDLENYVSETVWYEEDGAELRIGGKVWLREMDGRLRIEDYACLFRNGSLLARIAPPR